MKNDEVEKLNFSGWPVPDNYLIEVGRVSVLWAALESILNDCLGELAGFQVQEDPKSFILMNHMSFPQRLDILGALCELLAIDHPNLAAYKKVIQELRSAQSMRNKFAHHGLAFISESGTVVMPSGSARGTLKFSVEKVSIADIRRATIAISEASTALTKLVLKSDAPLAWKHFAAKNQSS